jgi:hypothetical protein
MRRATGIHPPGIALYTVSKPDFPCAMRQSPASILLPYALTAAFITFGGVVLQLKVPTLVAFLDNLLTGHVILAGAWFALAAAGVDYALVTLHRKLRMGEVGAKSAAQLHLSGTR